MTLILPKICGKQTEIENADNHSGYYYHSPGEIISDTLRRQGDFPGGAVVGKLPANAGDAGSSPGLGGSHMPWRDRKSVG